MVDELLAGGHTWTFDANLASLFLVPFSLALRGLSCSQTDELEVLRLITRNVRQGMHAMTFERRAGQIGNVQTPVMAHPLELCNTIGYRLGACHDS